MSLFPKAEATKAKHADLAAKLRRYADDIKSEGRTHAPRVMREAAEALEQLDQGAKGT